MVSIRRKQALGISAASIDCAVKYSLERKAFGEPISSLYAIQVIDTRDVEHAFSAALDCSSPVLVCAWRCSRMSCLRWLTSRPQVLWFLARVTRETMRHTETRYGYNCSFFACRFSLTHSSILDTYPCAKLEFHNPTSRLVDFVAQDIRNELQAGCSAVIDVACGIRPRSWRELYEGGCYGQVVRFGGSDVLLSCGGSNQLLPASPFHTIDFCDLLLVHFSNTPECSLTVMLSEGS